MVHSSVERTLSAIEADLVALRHDLHGDPHLSGDEAGTARRVRAFLEPRVTAKFHEGVGGHGLLVRFDGGPGPNRLFRCELDALPIAETCDVPHASQRAGVSHKCGHDGHMAIACGLGLLLDAHRPPGTWTLLFQPAEETGEGAVRVLEDRRVTGLGSDGRYAFHNLPGRPLGTVTARAGTMNLGSIGLRLTFTGKTSHAAEPERAISPRAALATLLLSLPELSAPDEHRLLTIVHARLGEEAFGVTPGDAVLAVTVRAPSDPELETLVQQVQDAAQHQAQHAGLTLTTERLAPFPTTVNHAGAVETARQAAAVSQLPFELLEHPIRWSEDFGHLLQETPGALLGLGSGTHQPALHRPEYDFPDALIVPGVRMAWCLMTETG